MSLTDSSEDLEFNPFYQAIQVGVVLVPTQFRYVEVVRERGGERERVSRFVFFLCLSHAMSSNMSTPSSTVGWCAFPKPAPLPAVASQRTLQVSAPLKHSKPPLHASVNHQGGREGGIYTTSIVSALPTTHVHEHYTAYLRFILHVQRNWTILLDTVQPDTVYLSMVCVYVCVFLLLLQTCTYYSLQSTSRSELSRAFYTDTSYPFIKGTLHFSNAI